MSNTDNSLVGRVNDLAQVSLTALEGVKNKAIEVIAENQAEILRLRAHIEAMQRDCRT